MDRVRVRVRVRVRPRAEDAAEHGEGEGEQLRGDDLHDEIALAQQQREERRDHLGRYRGDIGEIYRRYRGNIGEIWREERRDHLQRVQGRGDTA